MSRLARRAGLLFASYLGLLIAIGIAGFLANAIGIWASVLWGAAVITGLILYIRNRQRENREPQ